MEKTHTKGRGLWVGEGRSQDTAESGGIWGPRSQGRGQGGAGSGPGAPLPCQALEHGSAWQNRWDWAVLGS